MPSPAASRQRRTLDRAARWAKRHPLLTYVMIVAAGTVIAWLCEYATSAVPVALCHLRDLLQARLGGTIEEVLRRPLAP